MGMLMIPIKTKQQIAIIRQGGRILAEIMEELKSKVKPGITTNELNRAAEALIFKYGAEPAFKGYISKKGDEPFPSALCTSINSVVVHAAPSDYVLQQSDILSLDLGIKYRGFFVDMAITIFVSQAKVPRSDLGEIVRGLPSGDFEVLRLVRVTKKALKLAIKKARPGNTIGDIGNTIQRHIENAGFNVVRELCGHGIGRQLHEEPQIFNFGKRHKGEEIKPGMVFCLEPMTTIGDWRLKKSPDGFGYETKDGSLSAHFEHTVVITPKGAQVLTEL